jgi:hypothetical protein
MIPKAHITAWRARAPWLADAQVEQDLIISRAIVELFRVPEIGSDPQIAPPRDRAARGSGRWASLLDSQSCASSSTAPSAAGIPRFRWLASK